MGIWQKDWEPAQNLTLEASGIWLRTYIGLEKETLGGHRQNLVYTRTQEKGAVTPQETDPDCLWVSRSLVGQRWPAVWFGALSVAVQVWDIFKEVSIIFITSNIVWPQVNSKEGTQLHPSTENWIKDLLSIVLPIRTGPSMPPQSVSPIRKLP